MSTENPTQFSATTTDMQAQMHHQIYQEGQHLQLIKTSDHTKQKGEIEKTKVA